MLASSTIFIHGYGNDQSQLNCIDVHGVRLCKMLIGKPTVRMRPKNPRMSQFADSNEVNYSLIFLSDSADLCRSAFSVLSFLCCSTAFQVALLHAS